MVLYSGILRSKLIIFLLNTVVVIVAVVVVTNSTRVGKAIKINSPFRQQSKTKRKRIIENWQGRLVSMTLNGYNSSTEANGKLLQKNLPSQP